MKTTAIYPGSFDPVTNGHIDLITRASKLFDKVIVAVAHHTSGKNTYFATDKRIYMTKKALSNIKNVEVIGFDNLLVEFAKNKDVHIIIRGLRAVSDFEYEFQLAGMNRQLNGEIETLFMTPAEEYANISSSLVREIAKLGGDISKFAPQIVIDNFKKTTQ